MKLVSAGIIAQSLLHAAVADNLQPWTFTPIPAGHVKPKGWLLGELQAMASGLPGHEHDFYVFVSQSPWLSKEGTGSEYNADINEALPYWFNGLVPMAYMLDDDRLKQQVQLVAYTTLSFQGEDGWIGPEVKDRRSFWGRTPLFLGLTQLAEADNVWEKEIVTRLQRFFQLANTMLHNNGQGYTNCTIDCGWGQARVADLIITIQWLLEKHPSSNDSQLWETMNMLYDQGGMKWDQLYNPETYPKANPPYSLWTHGVNVGQGLKSSAVMWRFKGGQYFRQRTQDAVDLTFNYHGSASGTILADEHMRDDAQYIGSELCTAVETVYSFAYMYQVFGNNDYADRGETTLFNAMPAMITGDKWAHQYMSSPNMPFAVSTIPADGGDPPRLFVDSNSGVATTYGMEPQYPCCTVNHPQGYPKFAANSWVSVGTDGQGIGHALLSPSSIKTQVNGADVTIDCDTNYPFTNVLTYTITAANDFDFYVRVPSWADASATSVAVTKVVTGRPSSTIKPAIGADSHTGMQHVSISKGTTKVVYTIGTAPRTKKLPDNTVAIFYGNLLYSLDVGYTETNSLPHAWWGPKGDGISGLPFSQLRDVFVNSTQEWNVAIDPSTIRYYGIGSDYSMANPIFARGAPVNYMTVDGCQIRWDLKLGVSPDRPPADRTCISGRKRYRLIPHGSAKVHMSHIPVVQL